MSDVSHKTVLSGIQPTGDIHFGNYFGAIKNWEKLQAQYKCYYSVVDYHAMTMPFTPSVLRNNTWEIVINLLAIGINPENLFIQSLVPEHAELTWIFNCYCSYGQLMRMTQFKDKTSQLKEGQKDDYISVALLDYPVLQAADVLIYKADLVPVGKDQEQHLELTRDIAQRFNFQVGKEYFSLPEPLFTETPKIRSTADPSRKMSKSAGEKHYINLFADETTIRRQIKSAVTDTGQNPGTSMAEGVQNLFELIKASENVQAYDALLQNYHQGSLKYVDLKEATADSLIATNAPFLQKKSELVANKKQIKDEIKSSSAAIRRVAQETLKEVKELVGLLNVKY
ncbi:MAG: tryptophan--tRNA ligase [Lewinellaceae bacterium]|nr:tryptophan--tRNA ligase [Lewinellaceae bacterium]